MKLILIGNYKPDGQESMQRFANMLAEGFQQEGVAIECWRPKAIFGRPFQTTTGGIGKWFGYVDKWILFPFWLRFRRMFMNGNIHFHICDHSNAPYLQYLPQNNTVITCHDVIAVRAGLGYNGTYVSASRMGTVLQKWILKNLRNAPRLAAVSHLTMKQLKELTADSKEKKNWQVIHNGFNAPFFPLGKKDCVPVLKKVGINENEQFLLHVGSSLLRKNRKLLLEMVAALGNRWEGKICFAGKPLEQEMWQLADKLNLRPRIVSAVKPDHRTLQALYSSCCAFIFPSLSEGFGWPVIEAQACGAPVIASNIEPMPEIGGEGALYADPTQPEMFASALLKLQEKTFRDELLQKGSRNVGRFQPSAMIQEYLKIHGIAKYDI
jgi:glycosyltransferase involved in cell wall biosynthesis